MNTHHNTIISNHIHYIGVNDLDIDLFEGQYSVPNGISYNSYIIMDDKIAVMDTVDLRKSDEWLHNLSVVLNGKIPDYLVVLHMEPDHAGSIERFIQTYPSAKIVSNTKTFQMISQFFDHLDLTDKQIVVSESDTLSLGTHSLTFVTAPMVHWPEVMVAYESYEKILFSADAFGKFGAIGTTETWDDEARRYYINIVGKYGAPVQTLLKKASSLDIQKICPLHGPILTDNLGHYLNKYQIWSSYQPEEKGVLIAYSSIYGNTKQAVMQLSKMLTDRGVSVVVSDLARDDMPTAIGNAFRYDKMVLASVTYNGDMFPDMNTFIHHLQSKNYQNRTIALIENGSWSPMAAKKMAEAVGVLKNITVLSESVSIKSAVKEQDIVQLEKMADMLASI